MRETAGIGSGTIRDLSRLALLSLLAHGRQRLDLLDLVVVERGRRRLPALVRPQHRIPRKLERVPAAAIGEHRREHLAVLVDVARGQAFAVKVHAELEEVRRAGYATNFDEHEFGATAVAVPIPVPPGVIPAALTVNGPSARLTRDRIPEVVATARQFADRIAAKLRDEERAA